MRLPIFILGLLLVLSSCGSEDPGVSTEEFAPNAGANETFNNMPTGAMIPGGGLDLPPNQLVGGGPRPQAVLSGLTRQLRSGSYIPITFVFQDAGSIDKQVPVLPPSQWRATYSPTPSS